MVSGLKPSLPAKETLARSESETVITGPQQAGLEYQKQNGMDVEAYSMREMGGEKAPKVMAGPGLLRETQVLQTSEVV